MKIPKLYIPIILSVLLLLNGCNTDSIETSPVTYIESSSSSTTGLFNTHTTIFDSISAKLTDKSGILNGKVDIVGAHSTSALFFEMKEDIEIEVDYSLVRYKGDLRIAYIMPDKSEITLVDTSLDDNEMIDGTFSILLKEGAGRIEFFGDNTNYEFSFNFIGISPDNVSYFDIIEHEQ